VSNFEATGDLHMGGLAWVTDNLNYAQNERCERWFRAAEAVAG